MFLFNFRITCKEKFNMVLYVIYVSNIPVIQGIFKIISFREKRKAKRHLSLSSLLTSKDRSRYRLGAKTQIRARHSNPPSNPPPKNLPRKEKSATIACRRSGRWREKEPTTTPAKSSSLAWMRDFKKRPARRPAYSINAPRSRSEEGTREREKGDAKEGGHLTR